MFSCLGMDNSSVYIINRIIHGRLEIWNLSSRVHIYLLVFTRSLRSLSQYQCEHLKINSISPRTHVLFLYLITQHAVEEQLLMFTVFLYMSIRVSSVQCV